MTGFRTSFIASIILFSLAGMGCKDKVHDENQALWRQNRELQAKVRETEAQRDSRVDPSQLTAAQQQLQAKDAQIAQLESQLRQPQPGAQTDPALQGIEVTRDEKAGTLTVNIPGDVLFPSGKADLKDTSKSTLNKIIAAVKKDYPGKRIIVQGYTDTDPITRTKDKWKDNLDLSAERARSVAQYLVSQGIASKGGVGLQAYGDTEPKATKDRSRRVEIVVATRD
jgi:chemotaxis protein MotB